MPFAKEWELTQRYLEFEQLRYGGRLTVASDIGDECATCSTPSFALQTLVENAVRHSIATRPDGGRIEITAAADDARLHIRVRDDGGNGLPPAQDGAHFGLPALREHRSHVVSLSCIAALEPREGARLTVVLASGARIPTSRSGSAQLQSNFYATRHALSIIVPKLGMIVPAMGTRRSNLSDALFTQTQQRVLGLLYGHPDESFFATEIFRRTGVGRGTVQRELERLVNSGISLVSAVGNQKHFRANQESPIFSELRSIIVKTSGIAEPLRHSLAPLARRIELAFIYGSIARGEAHAGSDVDLLIVATDVTLEQLFSHLGRGERAVGRKINPTLLTPDEFARRRHNGNVFLTKVLSGPVIPLIGSVDGEATAR